LRSILRGKKLNLSSKLKVPVTTFVKEPLRSDPQRRRLLLGKSLIINLY